MNTLFRQSSNLLALATTIGFLIPTSLPTTSCLTDAARCKCCCRADKARSCSESCCESADTQRNEQQPQAVESKGGVPEARAALAGKPTPAASAVSAVVTVREWRDAPMWGSHTLVARNIRLQI